MNEPVQTTSKRFSRRRLLAGTGAVLIVAGGAGLYRAIEQDLFSPLDGPAFEPWSVVRDGETMGPEALVAASILASNAHNTQPWLFRITGESIELYADRARSIGAVDPHNREMEISLGCALENLMIAARSEGYQARLTLKPEPPEPDLIARIDLLPAHAVASPLHAAIPRRHTNRYAYDLDAALPENVTSMMEGLNESPDLALVWFADEARRHALADLLVEAGEAINADEEQSRDNITRWLRHDADAVQRHRDGLTMDVLGMADWELAVGKLAPAPSLEMASGSWLDALKRQANQCPAFGMIVARDPASLIQRLEAGRLWQRLHLWLTAQELAAQPMNQVHERVDRERQLEIAPVFIDAERALIGDAGWHPLFTFRFGVATEPAPPSPRRSVSAVASPA